MSTTQGEATQAGQKYLDQIAATGVLNQRFISTPMKKGGVTKKEARTVAAACKSMSKIKSEDPRAYRKFFRTKESTRLRRSELLDHVRVEKENAISCFVCGSDRAKVRGRRTRVECRACKVRLCSTCWSDFHLTKNLDALMEARVEALVASRKDVRDKRGVSSAASSHGHIEEDDEGGDEGVDEDEDDDEEEEEDLASESSDEEGDDDSDDEGQRHPKRLRRGINEDDDEDDED